MREWIRRKNGLGKMSKHPRTLVVDDSAYMRQMIVMMLKKIGINDIVQAEDGDEAIAILKGGCIGLVLLDCVMPKVGGMEVLKTVRADPALAKVPVILVTANADEETVKAALSPDARAHAVIAKPLSLATLKSRIEFVLGA